MKHVRLAVMTLLMPLALLSCVSTTTGGFSVESSREQALSDFIDLAFGYYEADDMVRAKRNVDNALAIDRRSSEAHHVRALIHQREGEPELARQMFDQAMRLDRNNSRARNNYAAFLFARAEFEQAYEHLEIVANDINYEARPLAFLNLGLASLRTGRVERAVYAFERGLLLDRNLYRASLELARIHFDQGEFAEAMRYYQQFVTSTEFYNVPQTAGSLWLGIQLARRFDDQERERAYAASLQSRFPGSDEYRAWLQSEQ